jgi:DNA-binding response OmpR family regulator
MARLLLVDDDQVLSRSVEKLLRGEGHLCRLVHSARGAHAALAENPPEGPFDLLLLDVSLPDQDGFSLCRQIRARHRMPILLLTGRGDSSDKVVGLEVGADDYVTKPFDPRELIARVRALLRRSQEYNLPPDRDQRLVFGDLSLDVDGREAYLREVPVRLTEREFELLHLLARHRDKALSSDWIFETVWGYDADLGLKALTVCIQRLRAKIEDDPRQPRLLLTVRGFGYKLISTPMMVLPASAALPVERVAG